MAKERSSGSGRGSLIQRQSTGGSWPKIRLKLMNSTGRQFPLAPETIFHRGHDWNTIRDTTPPMYLTRTDIRSKSSTKASTGISHPQRHLQRNDGSPVLGGLRRSGGWKSDPSLSPTSM